MVRQGPEIQHFIDAVDIMLTEMGSPDVFVPMVNGVKDEVAVLGQLISKLIYAADNLNSKYKALLKNYKNLKDKMTKLRTDKSQQIDKVTLEKFELEREEVENKTSPELHDDHLMNSNVKIEVKKRSRANIGSKKILQKGEQCNIKSFTCKGCLRIYSSKKKLMQHLEHCKGHECADQRKLSNPRLNGTRKRTLHSGSPYRCDICDKKYNFKSSLAHHKKTIHEDVKFACSYCPKEFANHSSVSRHLRAIHYGVKYTCKPCKKIFSYKFVFTQHSRRCPYNKAK